jgi:hypothetical protein
MLALSLSSWASLSCATSCSALTLSRSCWSFWQLAALMIPSTTTQASVVRVATTRGSLLGGASPLLHDRLVVGVGFLDLLLERGQLLLLAGQLLAHARHVPLVRHTTLQASERGRRRSLIYGLGPDESLALGNGLAGWLAGPLTDLLRLGPPPVELGGPLLQQPLQAVHLRVGPLCHTISAGGAQTTMPPNQHP